MTEVEVVTFVDLAGVQSLRQHLSRKIIGRHQRQVARKRQHQHRVHVGLLQQLQLGRQRSQQLGRNIRTQDAQRMRLERHHYRFASEEAGALGHVAHHFLVRAMHSVKVAHADHGGTEVRRDFIEMAEDLHVWAGQISNSSFSPSCDSRTLSGSVALVASCGRSCEMCVKYVRFGFNRSTIFSEFSTVECVGCG